MKASAPDPSNPRVQAQLRILASRTPNANDFQIMMSGDHVDVPFLVTDPLPVLHATINGVQATLFLDTNAGSIALSPDGAKRLGVTSHSAGQAFFAGGKTAEISAGRIDSVAFEGLTVRGITVEILPAPAKLAGYKIDGAIGDVFLQHFLSTIDYIHGHLTLRPRSASAAFESDALKSGATVVPMWLVGYQGIYCRARVGQSPEALFGIDTGGAGLGVQLFKPALDAAHIVPDESKAGIFRGGGGGTRVLPFTAPSVSIGAFTISNVSGLYFADEDQYKGQFDACSRTSTFAIAR